MFSEIFLQVLSKTNVQDLELYSHSEKQWKQIREEREDETSQNNRAVGTISYTPQSIAWKSRFDQGYSSPP